LGGRSRQEKWILQSELFNEISKLVENHLTFFKKRFNLKAERAYSLFRDYLKAIREVMAEVWGNRNYRFTEAVTLKALIRVLGDLMKEGTFLNDWEDRGEEAFRIFLEPWAQTARLFRADGFYERFPAKGPVERTRRIHEEFLKSLGFKRK
jgi:hypothetical protein